MKRRPFRFPLNVERLEGRDAPYALLAGVDDPLGSPLAANATTPQLTSFSG